MEMLASFVKKPARLSHLMERAPATMNAGTRRACQSLLYGTVRHIRFLEKGLDSFIKKRPKPAMWAALLVASREIMEEPEKCAKIVHHAVEEIGRKYSRAEKGLANAVLRKMPAKLEALLAADMKNASDLAWRYSHPRWMVKRWIAQLGFDATRGLLEWNQSEPDIYGRWQSESVEETEFLEGTKWADFLKLGKSAWPSVGNLLEAGLFYIQNPAARVAPTILAERFDGGRVLDLCSAPGGKTLLLEKLLGERVEEIVAVDLPGPRFERMEGNFARYGTTRIKPLATDLIELSAETEGLFEAVLLDAPCSNTGVFQHKVDARWRVSREGLASLLELQGRLLAKASELVASGGLLVYSTCSVDWDENDGVVAAFLESELGSDFSLEGEKKCLPNIERHDGAGVFVLRRV